MAGALKPEFPPLLAPGRHTMTRDELRALCVTHPVFSISKRRPDIMASLENLLNALSTESIHSEVWVDGSFLTQKIEPDDVDLVVVLQEADFPKSPAGLALLRRIAGKAFTNPVPCDSYIHVDFPSASPHFKVSEVMRAYWIKQFCFSRSDQMKGLAVIATP